jgi:hypothetical protein
MQRIQADQVLTLLVGIASCLCSSVTSKRQLSGTAFPSGRLLACNFHVGEYLHAHSYSSVAVQGVCVVLALM